MTMRRFLLVPDSFKGTLSAQEVCDCMKQAIAKRLPSAQVRSIPVADGGEGTVDAFLTACGGQRAAVTVSGPFFQPVDAFYGILPDGQTAVIEMAACAGLPLAQRLSSKTNPAITTTFGVGELLLNAVSRGCRRVILGLGGSATNDMGCGMAAACGVRFQTSDGSPFVPVGETLENIAAVDLTGLSPALRDVEILTMCDIDNPLCGPHGAACVFAPQKGADAAMVAQLDHGLRHCGNLLREQLGVDVLDLPGAGAAGGMGGGVTAFLGSRLVSGIDTLLDRVRFDELLKDTDCVFTGEGRLDSQSLHGKVLSGLLRRTRPAQVPLVVVAGSVEAALMNSELSGVTAVFSAMRPGQTLEMAMAHCRENLAAAMDDALRSLPLDGHDGTVD